MARNERRASVCLVADRPGSGPGLDSEEQRDGPDARAMTPTDARGNRLLAALGPDELARLVPHLERVELARGVVLHEPPGELAEVWFPEGCVISVVVVVQGGLAEGALVGREGVAGLVDALGSRRASARCLVQVPGPALRLELDRLAAAHEASPLLRRLLAWYVQAFLAEVMVSAACHALHAAAARLARWLLLVQDRAGDGAELFLTQEFLALMLGLQRTTVTETAGSLQRAGLIRYRRGRVEVLDRAGLEAAACGCYRTIRDHYGRLSGA
jgi:CRP-like cAMP-binding protein